MVHGLCRALLRDPVEAEDAVQQAFLSAHRSLLNGVEPREPAAWLATIARNECWARTSARMREPLPTDAIDEVATAHDPVDEAIRRADLEALWLAIRALPRQQRDALLLREFGGLRYDELAVALAVSEPSIESLLFRARTRLRTQLKAAYATLSGASWLESLARLLAGGGAPAVATKAVAIGLGAAAVTGGAVVAPTLLAPAHHAAGHDASRRQRAAGTLTTAAAPAAVLLPATRVATSAAGHPVLAFAAPRSHESRRQGEDTTPAAHEDHVRTETGDAHEGDNAVSSTASTREGDHSTSGSGSETSGDSHDGSTAGSTSGSTSTSGSDGEHDQPAPTTTTTTTATTTTVPTVTDPAVTVPTQTVPPSGEGDG